jgi:molecular chaperone DnaK
MEELASAGSDSESGASVGRPVSLRPVSLGSVSQGETWVLAIDFGTSSSVVAARVAERPPEVVEVAGERRVPSVVLITDTGELVVGRVAEDLAAASPDRALRAPKAHIGEPQPVILAGRAYDLTTLIAALLRALADAAETQMGSLPGEVRLTHPATWSGPRCEQLRRAARAAGLDDPTLIPEPVAAALAYAEMADVAPGANVAVYDLGGGTFDTTVLRAFDRRRFEIIGRPTGDGQLGGELFDELVLDALLRRLDPSIADRLYAADDPMWQESLARVRAEARRSKEALSSHPYADVMLALPSGMHRLRITRDELDDLLRPYVAETVEILRRSVADAGLVAGQLSGIYLAGGASRSPLVAAMVGDAFPEVTVSRLGDPKTIVAVGATLGDGRVQPAPPVVAVSGPAPVEPVGAGAAPTVAASTVAASTAGATSTGSAATGAASAGGPTVGDAGTVVESRLGPPRPAQPGTVVDPATTPATAAAYPRPGPPPASPPPGPPATPGVPPSRSGGRRRPAWALPAGIATAVVVATAVAAGAVIATGSSRSGPSPTTLAGAAGAATSTTGPADPVTSPPVTSAPVTSPPVTGQPVTSPPATSPSVTSAPPTTVPSAPDTVTRATQAQVDAALLTATDLGSATPDTDVNVCGNYPRSSTYALKAYFIDVGGDRLGIVANLVTAYSSLATAKRAVADIPGGVPSCNGASSPYTIEQLTSPGFCDQSYEGGANGVSIDGTLYDVFVGIVRCGGTVDDVEMVLRDVAGSDGVFQIAVHEAAIRLMQVVGQ